MNMQHTPAPWFAELDHVVARTEKGGYLTRQSSVAICYAEEDPAENHKNPEVLANARLIAAAPDLLKAVKALLETGLNGGNNVRLAYLSAKQTALSDEDLAKADKAEEALQLAYAAITKATTPTPQ